MADRRAVARVQVRIDRLACGNPGDVRSVGSAISELRIDYGPGYRIYYRQDGDSLIVLLCGGDKSSQERDIKVAQRIAKGGRQFYLYVARLHPRTARVRIRAAPR